MITSWLLVNTVAVAVLALIQYLMIRQMGIMLTRLGPIGARSVDSEGPRVNEIIAVQMREVRSQLSPYPADVLYLFGSRSCAICKEIRASAEVLATPWQDDVQLVLIYDEFDAGDSDEGILVRNEGNLVVAIGGTEIRVALQIDSVPFGVRVDSADRVIGKGLVNAISHIESLLELQGGQVKEPSAVYSSAISS